MDRGQVTLLINLVVTDIYPTIGYCHSGVSDSIRPSFFTIVGREIPKQNSNPNPAMYCGCL
jgi:hypothetical protein